MELNYYQQLIVIGMMKHRRDVVTSRFAGVVADIGLSRDARQRRRLAAYDAQAGLVPMRLSNLLGHVQTRGERVRFHREYARLEAMGLLERHYLSSGCRATHLRLTEAGQRIAENLLVENDSADGIATADGDGSDADGFPLLQLLGWQADCPPDAATGTIAADEPASPSSPPDTTSSSPGPPSSPLPAPATTCPVTQP